MRNTILVSMAFFLVLLVACGSKSASSPSPVAPTQASAAPQPTAQSGAASPTGAQSDVAPQSQGARLSVSGSIQSVSADKVTLTDGSSFGLGPSARIIRQQNESAGDLKKGDFVAITGKRQPDNTLLASIVSVFPASLSAVIPPGQRPLPEGNLMTNATIDTINGKAFTVTFSGGGAQITLAPDAQIIKQTDATPADLKVGEKISATVANGVAQSLTIQ